jgi:dihydroxyacetone kinase
MTAVQKGDIPADTMGELMVVAMVAAMAECSVDLTDCLEVGRSAVQSGIEMEIAMADEKVCETVA